MKILHLVHNFPPEFYGGTEVYLRALCRLQIDAGFEVAVIAGSEERKESDDFVRMEHEGIPVYRFHRVPRVEDFSVDFYLARFEGLFLDFLDRFKPDLVHLHHWLNLGNEILRAASNAGYPSVLTLHDHYPMCPRFFMTRPDGAVCGPEPCSQEQCVSCASLDFRGSEDRLEGEFRVRKESFRAEMAAAGRIVIPSQAHARTYCMHGLVREDDFVVLHHGLVRPVSRTVWKPNREGPLHLGTWGNLAPAKGIHVILAALREAGEDFKERVEVHLHGGIIDSAYEAELKEASRELPVHFHGGFSGASMEEVAEGMDLAVFPSLARESYSMVLDEAVALGLPVVVSDAGALPERVGEGGVVVPAGDAGALAAVLASLEGDRERLEDLSKAILKMSWTVEDNCRELQEIYEGALKAGPKIVPNRAQIRRTALLKGRIAILEHERNEREGSELRFSPFRGFVPLKDFASIPRGDVLILAPHPDDEVIGCGGVTALHADRGDAVTVVHLTEGAGGGEVETGRDLVKIRRKEADEAGRILGTTEIISFGERDGRLVPNEGTIEDIHELIQRKNPSVVYAPSPFEIHPDHTAALFMAMHILENHECSFSFYMYEVNEAMVPGFLIDITSVLDKKNSALACFESQIRLNDVRDKSISGARWRTANVDLANVTHAEAFIEGGKEDLRGLVARIKEAVKYIGKRIE